MSPRRQRRYEPTPRRFERACRRAVRPTDVFLTLAFVSDHLVILLRCGASHPAQAATLLVPAPNPRSGGAARAKRVCSMAIGQGSLGADVVDDVTVDPASFGRRRVFDEASVVEEVLDAHLLDEHEVVGEQATMAAPPHRFGAHDCHPAGPCQGGELCDPFGELVGHHVIGIGAELLVAQSDVRRIWCRLASTTERRQPPVVHPVLGEPRRHLLAGEVRVSPAAREPADVDDGLHSGVAGHGDELFRSEGAVSQRSNCVHDRRYLSRSSMNEPYEPITDAEPRS
jgi:hypothetical protein